jgi:S1-C subfamily serine protease
MYIEGNAGTYWHRVTCDIYFGNSGGGVWTSEGKLLGLASFIIAYNNMPVGSYYYIAPVDNIIDLL